MTPTVLTSAMLAWALTLAQILLALIVTATPGTLWVSFDPAKGVLTLHVLDLIDEDAWIATIKQRYERYLLEIFE